MGVLHGYEHKQTQITKVVSEREMLYYIALQNFTSDNAIAPAKWSSKIQSCIFQNIGPAFSGPPFSALPLVTWYLASVPGLVMCHWD